MRIHRTAHASIEAAAFPSRLAWPIVVLLLLLGGMPAAASANPMIAAVSSILPQPNQIITINGKGFGQLPPYVGDSLFIRIRDLTAHWDAGYMGDRPYDKIGLAVVAWTDSRIVLGGFRGAYGRGPWRLSPGNRLLIEIWNPQTHAGPATYVTTTTSTASAGSNHREAAITP